MSLYQNVNKTYNKRERAMLRLLFGYNLKSMLYKAARKWNSVLYELQVLEVYWNWLASHLNDVNEPLKKVVLSQLSQVSSTRLHN